MRIDLKPFHKDLVSSRFIVHCSWNLSGDEVTISSQCKGPVESLDFERSSSPRAKDQLWQRTCFEVFLRRADSESYVEWNFSPGGDFQRYEFEAYRHLASTQSAAATPAEFDIEWNGNCKAVVPGARDSLEVKLRLPLSRPEPSLIQIAWVLKEAKHEATFWALGHPSDRADFHCPDLFVPLTEMSD